MDSIYNAAPGIFEFTRDIASDTRTLVEYMRSQGIIEKEMRCQCGELMKKGKREDISDGEYWRCPVCETKKLSVEILYLK